MPPTTSRRPLTWTLAVSAMLAGCAATGYEGGSIHVEDAKRAADVRSCCRTLSEVLAVPNSGTKAIITFDATAPHYDFGNGLAPFANFSLAPAGARTVQVFAPMRLQGILQGGNGQAHYADVTALFLDSTDKVLEAKLLNSGQRWWGRGARALYKTFDVPAGATRLIVSTDPRNNRKTDLSRIAGDPDGPLVTDSLQEFGFAGIMPNGYHLSTYGPVVLQVNR